MKFDLSKLEQFRAAGYIGTQRHPALPLLIHNYTQRCQFDRVWNETTLACRGLITDESGNVIARPFHKFFNLEEHLLPNSTLPEINWQQDFYVSEKLDGSLGVLYPTPRGPAIATRGSFVSDQAKAGTDILIEKYGDWRPSNNRLTYLFEIIYPGNRIVVDYGDMRELVLLDVIDNETGRGLSRREIEFHGRVIGCPVVSWLPDVDADSLSSYETGEANREGVVVRFDDGMRIKIKLGEYKRLHRLITGLNARKIWGCLSTGTPLDLERVPDEFFRWVEATKEDLLRHYQAIVERSGEVFRSVIRDIGANATRKEFALRFMQTRDISAILFAMLDVKDISPLVWKMVYPAHSVPWKDGDAP